LSALAAAAAQRALEVLAKLVAVGDGAQVCRLLIQPCGFLTAASPHSPDRRATVEDRALSDYPAFRKG
jgi:hypothetical protein